MIKRQSQWLAICEKPASYNRNNVLTHVMATKAMATGIMAIINGNSQ